MTINTHATEFAGLPVREYDPAKGITAPVSTAQRVALAFRYGARQGDLTFAALLARFLDDPACRKVSAIVIGPWWDGAYQEREDSTSATVVAALVAARDRLPALRAIFLGDITYEENEITWIKQSDVTPLLEAFPALEHLKVRGSGRVDKTSRARVKKRLTFRPVEHEHLRSLVFEAGCLPADVTRAVAASKFPHLEHLELWLGGSWSSDCAHSGDTAVKDLKPILSGDSFPALKRLGLRNSSITDQVAVALAKAPILRRLEALDLSLGSLGDRGALALLGSGALGGLKALDIHHHYVSDEVLDGLKALGLDLNADDRQKSDGDSRYIALGE